MRLDENFTAMAALIAGAHADFLMAQPRYQDPRALARYGARVYSQNNEDGFIAEIFRRIGTGSKRFIEIGAGDGEENNTRFLLENGWVGGWCEAAPENVAAIRAGYAEELAARKLMLIEQPVTRENAASLLGGFNHVDLLSIDIDMNTSHVWGALSWLHPRAAVIEYNPAIPASVEWEVPYRPDAVWAYDNYYGASLKRLQKIGWSLAYCLVGCELTGTNAFFVRGDLVGDLFLAPFTAEAHYEPMRLLPPVGQPVRPRPRAALKQAA